MSVPTAYESSLDLLNPRRIDITENSPKEHNTLRTLGADMCVAAKKSCESGITCGASILDTGDRERSTDATKLPC